MGRKLLLLFLVVVCGLVIGCAVPSATSPPSSEYPADIIGRVTIAGFLTKSGSVFPPSENETFWVVNLSVTNEAYELPVTGNYEHWRIVAGGSVYWIPELLKLDYRPPSLSVPVGQTGEMVICFRVPSSLMLSDAQIAYQGQKPYSFGRLTGGDKVAGYDWGLKKVVAQATDLRETYAVPDAYGKTTTKQLRTIGSWSGTESRAINFSADKSPWVVNGNYEVVSSLGHNFDYIVFTEDEYKAGDDALRQYLEHELLVQTRSRAGENYLVKQSGKFVICVYASGVKWQLKVGVE